MNSLKFGKVNLLAIMITALNLCIKNIIYAIEASAKTKQRDLIKSIFFAIHKDKDKEYPGINFLKHLI